ncbi:hypothetical protein BWO91_06320 [Plantibacter flavus]|uniref:phage tail domain-containing protein n=1 Tax=Plantibacter flavus TaxID=150123 RepID=UPI00099D0A3D|nr:phage tail domain-containing protein [Plantibacter flavus]AQX79654.1 hypothetical protein BWO91_06320 [Plantibacter flavus]
MDDYVAYGIDLGGIWFDGTTDVPTGWGFSGLNDWRRLPDSKNPSDSNPLGDGDFTPGEILRSSLAVSFDAFFLGEDAADALAAQARITAWGAFRTPQPMTVHAQDGSWTRMVSIRAATPKDNYGGNDVEFAIDVLAHDPIRYGPEFTITTGMPDNSGGYSYPYSYPYSYAMSSNSGRLVIPNTGSADGYPLLEVTGGMSLGVELVVNGRGRLRVERPIGDTQSLVFDTAEQRVFLDGISPIPSRLVTARDWFSVPPEGSTTVTVRPLGTVTGDPKFNARMRAASW